MAGLGALKGINLEEKLLFMLLGCRLTYEYSGLGAATLAYSNTHLAEGFSLTVSAATRGEANFSSRAQRHFGRASHNKRRTSS